MPEPEQLVVPLVLVGLSTGDQGQADLLRRCVDAVVQLPVHTVTIGGCGGALQAAAALETLAAPAVATTLSGSPA